MSQDALDHTGGYKKFSKAEKREFAINKQEEETRSILQDQEKVRKGSQAFRDHVAAERKRLGLDKTTMFCKTCYRENCVCELQEAI